VDRGPNEAEPPARPVPAGRPVRWGLGDFAAVYVVGIVGGAVGGAIGAAITGDTSDHTGALTTGLLVAGQFGGWFAALEYVARNKGRSLAVDFGFRLDISKWWGVFAGLGTFLVASLIIAWPHSLVHQDQKVVDDLASATGLKLAVLVIFAGIVAPVCEELLFRGLLLRALRRRMSPALAVGVQALVFALAHPALSPHLGDLVVVPALFLLGTVSGVAAVATDDLSASILMHIGFNLVTTLAALG
jgi:uncharacterized protein